MRDGERTHEELFVHEADLGPFRIMAAEVCVSLHVCVAVCMTAPLTGISDNGRSNRSPREAEAATVGVCMCLSGEGGGGQTPPSRSPPTAVPGTKTRVHIKHTHTHTRLEESELAPSRFETVTAGQRRSDGVWLDRGAPWSQQKQTMLLLRLRRGHSEIHQLLEVH